ncbi:Ig-like domain-containing protein [Porticoccaceae bacterium LTM1]|nr:Ig-like domain-containing protein [Porticoccaceae bacterium LTM1]
MKIRSGLLAGWRAAARLVSANVVRKTSVSIFSLALLAPAAQAHDHEHEQNGVDFRSHVIKHFSESSTLQKKLVAKKLTQGNGRWAELNGTIEVFYEDHSDQSHSRLVQFLTTDQGERIQILTSDEHPAFANGTQVNARGLQVEDTDQDLIYLALDPESSSTTSTSTSSLAQTTGDQKTLTIMVNFNDNTSQPFTKAQVENAIYTEVNQYLYENSFGKLSISGAVTGWHTINVSSTNCDTNTIRSAANTAATNSGYNIANYQRIMYLFPKNSCSWAGYASVSGSPSYVWLNGKIDMHTVGHEIGHTLGLMHAHAHEADNEVISNNGVTYEYGDTLDIMGTKPTNLNAFNMELLNWFDNGDVQPITNTGSYQLDSYGTTRSGLPKALRISRGTDASGAEQWMYLEYRTAVGYDSIMDSDINYDSANYNNGVVLRLGTNGNSNSSFLLDATPNSSSFYDWTDTALEAGNSFTDPKTGTTITVVSADGNRATVDINLGSSNPDPLPVCERAVPSVSLQAISGTTAAPGQALSYRLTVTNNDSSECSNAQFNLGAAVPYGWSKSLSSSQVTLAPGSSSNITLYVTSSSTALDGAYSISGNATHSTTGSTRTASATYTVKAPVTSTNSAPTALNDSANTPEKTAVTITVLANDSDPDGDAISVVGVSQPSKGSVSINSNGTVTYVPPRKFTGTQTFSYTISDGKKQATASVTVTVANSSDGSTGGGGKGGGGKGGRK